MGEPRSWSFLNPSLFVLFFFSHIGLAQESHTVFLARNYEYKYQSYLNNQNVSFHSAIKPLTKNDFRKTALNYDYGFPIKKTFSKKESKPKIKLGLYPLLEAGFNFNSNQSDTLTLDKGIGLATALKIQDKLNARIEFSVNQFSTSTDTEHDLNQSPIGVDGQLWHTQNNGYHTTNTNGYLDYTPNETFNFQIGHGRNFLGDGYRSMFLSDNAGNYSYGKIAATIWRLKYIVLYAHLRDIGTNNTRKYNNLESKLATIHYLSWNVNKWLNIGFFESVVWLGKDTLLDRGYDVNYLNPLIFMRPVEYSTGSSDNSLLGISINAKPKKGWLIYSQFLLDEFLLSEIQADVKDLLRTDTLRKSGWWANKYAIQLGTRLNNLFGLKGLGFQSEVNLARPFTYSHGNSKQNYGHLNRSLAHPLGANFIESITFISYQKENTLLELKFQWYQQGMSTQATNFGENIFQSYRARNREYGHYLGQGANSSVSAVRISYSYIILPQTNLRFFCDATLKKHQRNTSTTNLFLSLGIKSTITNRYNDI